MSRRDSYSDLLGNLPQGSVVSRALVSVAFGFGVAGVDVAVGGGVVVVFLICTLQRWPRGWSFITRIDLKTNHLGLAARELGQFVGADVLVVELFYSFQIGLTAFRPDGLGVFG
ncbi:MAG: hypothetical protein M2R45_03468 [Verrucomicrobia subdivision 3 bacterium]|nr:hypothetical protein [Limisphaerales bacterium]MCS1416681.1 hypothetical protein [Limisphaerales bacterium]